jgi:hypothetical protein
MFNKSFNWAIPLIKILVWYLPKIERQWINFSKLGNRKQKLIYWVDICFAYYLKKFLYLKLNDKVSKFVND